MRSFKWRYLDNLRPSLAYRSHHGPLSGEAGRVLKDLDRYGIAITSANTLLGSDSLYGELRGAAYRLERDMAKEIAAARAAAYDPGGHKGFIFSLLGDRPALEANAVYARFALQEPILQIANAYFGMHTRLRYFNVWYTFATQVPPRDSQLWHRDPEDHHILKVFLYLSDVGDGAGPVIYAAGSHPKGTHRREPDYSRRKGDAKRSSDAQMADVIPSEQWIKGVGPEGTMIFADTRGYHKGGLARERDRIMYLCMFTSQASRCANFFERPSSISFALDREQAFALSLDSNKHFR